MSSTWKISRSIIAFAAAGAWIGGLARVAEGAFGTTSKPKTQTSMQKVQPSPKEIQFNQKRSRAMAAKAPGGNPGGQSNALMAKLKRQYAAKVETGNARVQALFGRLSPPGGGRAPARPKGKSGPLGASASGPAPIKPPDPCAGQPLQVKAIQSSPPLEPGEKIFIDGCGFGYPTDSPRSEVFLYGDGFPGGRQKLTVEGCLPMGILAKVPMIQGVPDIPTVKLQVVRGGQISSQLDVGGFRATREVKPLLPGDVDVTCYHPRAQAECMLATSGGTLAAKHAISAHGLNLDCEDALDLLKAGTTKDETDTYTVKTLMNGWILGGYNWWWAPEDDGYVMAPVGIASGSNSSTIKMKWGLYANHCSGPRDSDVRYRVDLYAVGPKGTSYK